MEKQKTIGELMEEMRLKAGAKEYAGHSYMDLNRFADDTRHMIIFDVKSGDCAWGDKGERIRLFLNDAGYGKAKEFQEQGQIKVVSHARVSAGHLFYDKKEQVR